MMLTDGPNFHLERVILDKNDMMDFDGPLSLILLLLQKNKIEIRDLKISEILDQYLEYLDKMQQLDLEVASEFVRMASYLIYIKSKTILLNGEEEVSELELLIDSLEQLKAKSLLEQVSGVLPDISDAYKLGALLIAKQPEPLPKHNSEYNYSHTPAQLLKSLYNVLSSTKEKPVDTEALNKAIPQKVVYSVKNKSLQILSRLKIRDISLNELYSECHSRSEMVATFVSVLELCSIGSIHISYSKNGVGYDLSFAGGNFNDILEKIEE